MSTPRLEIRLDRIAHNTASMVSRLAVKGISVTAVTKSMLGEPRVAEALFGAGAVGLADSRLRNMATMRNGGIRAPMTMVRTPLLSEVDGVVHDCETSCNTESAVLVALSAAAVQQERVHQVLLMVELGDLREGIMPAQVVGIAQLVAGLPNLTLHGLGANLACRHGVVPDDANMAELSAMVDMVELATGAHLAVVSGGNSANLGWALGPAHIGRINDLRLGEALLLGRDPVDRRPIDGLCTDAVTLVGEVIESGPKPSTPWGRFAQNAFGQRTADTGESDEGDVMQTIVALGRQDTDPEDLEAPAGMTIMSASSDHLVTRTEHQLAVGTEVRFRPGYSAVLRSMSTPTVAKLYSDADDPHQQR
ncbi:MAG: alanine/ornithine racemase family PLP-dependent enzyme [Microthrixaceae bacterium]